MGPRDLGGLRHLADPRDLGGLRPGRPKGLGGPKSLGSWNSTSRHSCQWGEVDCGTTEHTWGDELEMIHSVLRSVQLHRQTS